jgi:hypothetical protein
LQRQIAHGKTDCSVAAQRGCLCICMPACLRACMLCCVVLYWYGCVPAWLRAFAVLPWPSSQAAMAVYLEQRTARGSMSGCGCWIDAGAAVERVLRCASRQRAGESSQSAVNQQSTSNQRAGAPLDSCPTIYTPQTSQLHHWHHWHHWTRRAGYLGT